MIDLSFYRKPLRTGTRVEKNRTIRESLVLRNPRKMKAGKALGPGTLK